MTTKTKQRISRILLWVLIVVMAIWMLFPFYWAVNSLSRRRPSWP